MGMTIRWRVALCLAGLLAGGCATEPADANAPGAKPRGAHAGAPMAFSARVVGDFSRAANRDSQPAEVWPHGATQAHAMDFALRPGEKLIRSERNEGRFPYPDSGRPFVKEGPAGWKGEPRAAPFRTDGNGRWIYEPNLAVGYLDFAVGVRERHGIEQTEEGLAGAGQCVIPFVSPDPFAAVPDYSGAQTIYHDGSWLTLRASGDVKVEIGDPLGSWNAVAVAATGAEERIDISPLLESRCNFNIRLTLGANARVSKFRFEGYLLTAPLTLPRLDEGVNVMTLKCKDKYGLATVPCEILPDFRTTAAVPLSRQAAIRNGVVRPGADPWQVIAPKEEGPVQATFTFDAPAGEKFAWFYALASVAVGPTNAPPQHAKLEWRGEGGEYRSLAEMAIGNSPPQRDCRMDGEQILDRPGRTVVVRVTSDTPIGGLGFVGHLAYDAAISVRPEITHRWREGNTERQFVAPPESDRYWFRCGPNPSGHVMEMSVPSVREMPLAM